jgi:hypothetical protein
MTSVQQVGQVVERAYEADALTIACQVLLRLSMFEIIDVDAIPGR